MITLRFTYHEIIDSDFTAVDVYIMDNESVIEHYRNYDPSQIAKDIYANQDEDFVISSFESAKDFILSNAGYTRVPFNSLNKSSG